MIQREHSHHSDEKPSSSKLPMLVLAIGGVLFTVLAVTYWLLGAEGVHPLWLIGAAALISIALPMLRANLFPSTKDCTSEYDFHEKRLDEHIRQQIADKLGAEALEKLYSTDDTPKASAMDRCREYIHDNPASDDTDLRFALLVLLARIHESKADPEQSIQCLAEAIDLEPNHFIANFRIAINYEWLENRQSAIQHYRRALGDPGGISRAMGKLANAQIERLQKKDQ